MKNYTFLLIITLSLIKPSFFWSQNIVINEIQSSNSITIADEDGDYSDWIELYNNGSVDINLSGYGLSDNLSTPLKWIFPNITLPPNQYLLVWASGKDRKTIGKPLHTNFKIDKSGNQIILANPSGSIVDDVPATELISDISYGRKPNGTGNFVYFKNCTPNTINSSLGFNEFLNPPLFSSNSGFLTQGFDLSISSSTPGVSILYTLDGSEPNEANLGGTTYQYKNQYPKTPGQTTGPLISQNFKTLLYNGPISIKDRTSLPNKIASISSTYDYTPFYIPSNPIFKGTIVRAKVIKPGALSSPVISKSYFITPQGGNRFTLPVVSISLNENEFFDYNIGTYVAGVDFDNWRTDNPTLSPGLTEGIGNYYRLDDQYERRANFSYFENGIEKLNQDIGIQIHGGGSRVYQSKSLSINCRSEYGKKSLDHPFFKDVANSSFKRMVLRNSGTEFAYTMFRDALCQELTKSLNCETEAYQPSVVFLNGEYWGILDIREKYNDEYFKDEYNFGTKELDYIENIDYALEGDQVDYHNLTNYLENNNLAGNINYEYIKTRIDIESFSDFFISNIFLQNSDWPGNNVQCWRKKTNGYIQNAPYGHDGRWRWAFHDMDNTFAFGTSATMEKNTLELATASNGPDYPNPPWSTLILRKLLENSDYKNYFINRFADLLNTNFLPERVKSTMNTMKSVIEPEMNEHISRWKAPADISKWNDYLNIQANFADKRPDIQRSHIRSKFNIDSNINVSLNISDLSHGYIKINTINIIDGTPGIIRNPYPWTGIYFRNIPIKLKAIAFPGYAFSHWSGASTSTSPEITLSSSGEISITAHFVPAASVNARQIIYFWMMNNAIDDNTPLTSIKSTYSFSQDIAANLEYQSCLSGYPFTDSSSNWRRASMERRNSPTPLNYIQEVNNNLPFLTSNMRGIQIKQPFQNENLQNSLILNVSTQNFKNIILDFAVMDEGAASGISIDYSTSIDNLGKPIWTSTGMTTSSFPISTNSYQIKEVDLSNISETSNNPNLKIRIRFTGSNMEEDNGGRVTFNNISIQGVPMTLDVEQRKTSDFVIYPNPIKDQINISSIYNQIEYKIFAIEGKLIKKGLFENGVTDVSDLKPGLYLIELSTEGKSEIRKIIKH